MKLAKERPFGWPWNISIVNMPVLVEKLVGLERSQQQAPRTMLPKALTALSRAVMRSRSLDVVRTMDQNNWSCLDIPLTDLTGSVPSHDRLDDHEQLMAKLAAMTAEERQVCLIGNQVHAVVTDGHAMLLDPETDEVKFEDNPMARLQNDLWAIGAQLPASTTLPAAGLCQILLTAMTSFSAFPLLAIRQQDGGIMMPAIYTGDGVSSHALACWRAGLWLDDYIAIMAESGFDLRTFWSNHNTSSDSPAHRFLYEPTTQRREAALAFLADYKYSDL